MSRHGTVHGYRDDRCKCERCRAAIAKEHNIYKMRVAANGGPLFVNKRGAVRRLQALMALGWPRRTLGIEAGYKSDVFAMLLYSDRELIQPETFKRISDLYDRLCMTPGPSARARSDAAKKNWPTPLLWDDIDNDESPAGRRGSGGRYLSAELVSEWDFLRSAGESIDQAARQLGVTVGAIEKALERVSKERAA